MANTNLKTMKKKDWQELAKSYKIKFTPKNEVRYLVEKIAEKLGIDDDIVKLDDLKKAVHEKISAPVLETKVEVAPKIEEVAPTLSKLDQLREQCTSLGLAYAPNHKESDLEQLISAYITAVGTSVESVTTDTSGDFELSVDNFEEVIAKAPENVAPVSSNSNTSNHVGQSSPILEQYRGIFTQTIRGHFRLLTIPEIRDMIERDKYPFTYTINHKPNQSNLIEIIFASGNNSVRLPSNDGNDWFSING